MGAPHGSRGSIADLVAEALVSKWEVPTVCEMFESGAAVGNVEHALKAGAERRSTGAMTLVV